MAYEVFDGTDMVRQLFGESQSVTDEARDTLPQRVIEALNMIGFPGVLRDGFVLRLCGQKIQMSLFPFSYDVSPPRVAPLDFTPTTFHSQ